MSSLFRAIEQTVRLMPRGYLWSPSIETQLNFDLTWGEYRPDSKQGREHPEKPVTIRIPHQNGSFDDTPYYPSWDKLVGIGISGWDWCEKVSRFFFLDFDATDHAKGLASDKLSKVIDRLRTVPWIELRRSKGGLGIQALVRFKEPLRAFDHKQHADYAKRVADFLGVTDDTDAMGVIGWIFHRSAKPGAWELVT